MAERGDSGRLQYEPKIVRGRLVDLLKRGQALRADAARVAGILALPWNDIRRLTAGNPDKRWVQDKKTWTADVANVLTDVFATRAALQEFNLAGLQEEAHIQLARDDEDRFLKERAALDPKLSALERIAHRVQPADTVFLVHGRDERHADLISLLGDFGLNVVSWSEAAHATGKGAPTTLEIVQSGMAKADAVVVLFTPDDIAHLRPGLQQPGDPPGELEPTGQPRMNVLFEAGMAMALSGDRHRLVIVEIGSVRQFTDISGINIIRLTNSTESRRELAERLATAGLEVRLPGENTGS